MEDRKTKPNTIYAIRVRKYGQAIGWVKGISLDIISGYDKLHLSRYRKGCAVFDSKKAAEEWLKESPTVYSRHGYSFDFVGRRQK